VLPVIPEAAAIATLILGSSELGTPIRAHRAGDATSWRKVLVVGCIHGDECAGAAVVQALRRARLDADLWLVPTFNPDGRRRRVRQNARGVDLNRNFASGWRRRGRRWDPYYGGPRAWSERETRIARKLILRVRPDVTIWYHQPQGLTRAWGASVPEARRFARLAGERFRVLRWPPGTASNWQNQRFPGTTSFVVELPPGPMRRAAVLRHARAVVRMGESSEPVRWRRSQSFGLPYSGGLRRGVLLPAESSTYYTWDPLLRRTPSRAWRRWGNGRLVGVVRRVLAEFARAHPAAPRVGVGDLSRRYGGDFGPRFGLPGHVSHQNGLDVDIYYPRLDGLERAPTRPSQIDRALAQDLVDRFVRAGAVKVFVGPRTGLRGDPRVVQPLVRHDNHLHVRIGG
jgi:murein endopeptidase